MQRAHTDTRVYAHACTRVMSSVDASAYIHLLSVLNVQILFCVCGSMLLHARLYVKHMTLFCVAVLLLSGVQLVYASLCVVQWYMRSGI